MYGTVPCHGLHKNSITRPCTVHTQYLCGVCHARPDNCLSYHSRDDHQQVWFYNRLSLSCNYLCAIVWTHVKSEKGEGEPVNEVSMLTSPVLVSCDNRSHWTPLDNSLLLLIFHLSKSKCRLYCEEHDYINLLPPCAMFRKLTRVCDFGL